MRSAALLLAVTTAVLATSAVPVVRPDVPSAAAAPIASTGDPAQRGRELFESLFFLQGGDRTRALLRDANVSALTDDEVDAVLRAVSTPEAQATVRDIEDELLSENAQYFVQLGSLISSRDPVALQHGLSSAYEEMLRTPTMGNAVASLEAESTYVPGEIGTDCGVAVVVALGAVIAVTAVAAVNYALAANIALGFNVAAGTNVAYQVNAVKTKSKSAISGIDDRFSDGIVAAVIAQFGR